MFDTNQQTARPGLTIGVRASLSGGVSKTLADMMALTGTKRSASQSSGREVQLLDLWWAALRFLSGIRFYLLDY